MLCDSGTTEGHLVALTPYGESREKAEALADQIHRVPRFCGVEAVLQSVIGDSAKVTIAVVEVCRAWRSAHSCRRSCGRVQRCT
jgi:hypothetical protein